MDSSTCEPCYFQVGTHYLELGFEYHHETLLMVTGRCMACGVVGAQCDAFSTTVVAQGRDPATSAGAPLCGKAEKCHLVDMAITVNGVQECSYMCFCNGQGNANCQKVVMYFGNGSLAFGCNAMSTCDVTMTVWDHHIFNQIVLCELKASNVVHEISISNHVDRSSKNAGNLIQWLIVVQRHQYLKLIPIW